MEGLRLEWLQRLKMLSNKEIETVYFGGGTPSLLGPEAIGTILEWVRKDAKMSSHAEITLEANPESTSAELLKEYARTGVNRLSFGVQTMDPILLKRLERLHSAQRSVEAIHEALESGITNISIDLMYDLPNQTLESWENSLQIAGKLPITHLSLYNLTIEPHTVFFKQKDTLLREIPDPETSLSMYVNAIKSLEGHGLKQYEISAFAKEGFHSRHNLGYWTGRPFLGYGPSAFSYWEGKRFRNIANLSKYCNLLQEGKLPVDFEEELSPKAQQRELIAIQLRTLSGIELNDIDNETEIILRQLCEEGFMVRESNRYRLTQKGVLFYDSVATDIIL